MEKMPQVESLMNPILRALFALGGAGTVNDIDERVLLDEKIEKKFTEILHEPKRGKLTEIRYRLAWARTYLKKYGLITNSTRGIWCLTALANEKNRVIPKVVVSEVRKADKEFSISSNCKHYI